MRILKSHTFLNPVNSYLVDSPQPSNLSYLWNFGSLLGLSLLIQIITGVFLAMHYIPSTTDAFNSVEHIMRDVNYGWLIRYFHSNTASAFFFLVYLHIGRGLYYGSFKIPRTLVWTIGTIIFILMMATAFLGYVLPYGQMSLWGATVITNLMSAIPWVGQDIVEFIWGGFSVNNATLNRFFALHYLLPFILSALALMHLIALHDSAGSGNPLGVSANQDRLPFAPYFIFKDLITIFIYIIVLSIFVFFMPNVLGDSENYVMANPMQTPSAIVPEWYLLPFYAILRSIPNKLLGVIAMFSAILILLTLPIVDLSNLRGIQFKPFSKIIYFMFINNFFILMLLGAKHVEEPYIELGQISTIFYFSFFFFIIPLVGLFENVLLKISSLDKKGNIKKTNFPSLNSTNFPFNKHMYLNRVLQSSPNKLILFSVIILNNGTLTFTIMDPNLVLSYLKSIIPKISVPSFIPCSYNTSSLDFNFSKPRIIDLVHNNPRNSLFDCTYNKFTANIDIAINNIHLHYEHAIESDILNIYHHNHHLFMGIIALILYQGLPLLRNFFVNNFSHIRNLRVFINTNNVTIPELQNELNPIFTEINRLLGQLRDFITRFNKFIIDNNINVITEADGSIGIDVVHDLDQNLSQQYANRIDLLDNLIRSHHDDIQQLIDRGSALERQILSIDPSYNSRMLFFINSLEQIINTYAHR